VLRTTRRAAARSAAAAAAVAVASCCVVAGPAGAATLADHRGYELVSPPSKNGGDILGDSARVRAATGEAPGLPMAVSFASLLGFGDVRGTGVATEYLSERDGVPGTNGWSTHAITPPQDPLSVFSNFQGEDPLYQGDFSDDLTSGVFRAWSPLTDAPNVASVENLDLRHDLRSAGTGTYQLLSDAVNPLGPNFRKPFFAGASKDFDTVLFESQLSLTSDVVGNDFKLYMWNHGVLSFVGPSDFTGCPGSRPCSVAGLGAARQHYTTHAISDDGSDVYFTSPVDGQGAPNADTGPTASKVYLLDTGTGTTTQVNASELTSGPDPNGEQAATFWDASPDGRRAFFTSSEALTDGATSGTTHLYMFDATQPPGSRLTQLDVDGNPDDGVLPVDGVVGVGGDGHYVYFAAAGQLVAGEPALGANTGLYLWHDGQLTFIGTLTHAGVDEGLDLNPNWNLGTKAARVTPDGKHLLFASNSGEGFTGYDQASACTDVGDPDAQPGCTELYVFSADSGQLVCASCNPSGPATVDATDNVHGVSTGGAATTWHLSHALSDDGKRVFFTSAEALVPDDTNNKTDAYEYDVPTGTLHLLSSGKDQSDSFFMDASTSGDDAFFMTRQQLVGWDTDQNYDLYDARVDGGFPDPVPTPACSGDQCQGTPSAPPSAAPPSSLQFHGLGNVSSPPRKARPKPKPVKCKRGFVRRKVHGKVRCVRKKKPAAKRARHGKGRGK